MSKRNLFTLFFILNIFLFNSCKKEYFINGGRSNGVFAGNALMYLESQPFLFDTLVQVIKKSGLEHYFKDSTLTFFAPTDSSILKTYNYINLQLKNSGADTLLSIQDLKPEFWRTTLMMYMFRGKRGLEDYPQLDLNNIYAFPGVFARSYNGRVMNIGVVYNDAAGLKYKGYRYLNLSFIYNEATPYQSWQTTRVATSNIKPDNGYIHVLNYGNHYFGFDANQVWQTANYLGFE